MQSSRRWKPHCCLRKSLTLLVIRFGMLRVTFVVRESEERWGERSNAVVCSAGGLRTGVSEGKIATGGVTRWYLAWGYGHVSVRERESEGI